MHIEHIAIWTKQLETLKDFYVKYFNAVPNEKYINPKKGFSSYFLSFGDGCRLEIMEKASIPLNINNPYDEYTGLIHFAMSVGSKEKVDEMTEIFRKDGFEIVGEPRTTGDGYYESVILDPDKNRIEITN
ncbi:lactoylglutathione lyase [Arcicella aurantiaca]|uniref:Lactoylglutathione lyase n=1 Tax=Arcicella aurantiaca TaxID=591202 RepID=A0A316E927_9BACT|nr:VOC family protein [Arcicella aurantiaca]PWK26485.1 lactoylglutathione lyase [Arcicella aurantiaca]